MARVALVTCAQLPALDSDTCVLAKSLALQGVSVVPAVWDDPTVDWDEIDLAVVRSCWDYCDRRAEFLEWAARVPRLANPPDVLAWNTDKRYLVDLAQAGVPTVPTTWLDPLTSWMPPASGEWVVKPSISLASLGTGRYQLSDEEQRHLATAHVSRLWTQGRTAMLQPYLSRIDNDGEMSLVFIAGTFSHAMRKAAVLEGPDTGMDRRFLPQGGLNLQAQDPTPAQLAVAQRALSAVPGGPARLLYARVDLVPTDAGEPLLMELELTEPQLYFALRAEAADRFAAAIVAAVTAKRMAGA